MKIKYATVIVRIGKPYNVTLSQSFRVKEGKSYLKQGFELGHILEMKFVEEHFDNVKEGYKYIGKISNITVKRFSA